MTTYGSPVLFNSRFRAFHDPPSPNNLTSWGAAAGRLNYSSPIAVGNRWAVSTTTGSRSSSIANCTEDSVGSPHCVTLRMKYGSSAGSPVTRRGAASFSSDRSYSLSTFSDFPDAGLHVASISRIVQDDSPNISSTSLRGGDGSKGRRPQARTALPAWTLDETGEIKLTLAEILHYNQIRLFARDKMGCQFLQNNFPAEKTTERQQLAQQILEDEETFECLCADVFGNFFVQRLIECSNFCEKRWISTRLLNRMNGLCLNRYSCRVVQKAIEVLPLDLKGVLLIELHQADIVRLCTDQNANHVIQKIMDSLPLNNWTFLVEYMTSRKENLFAVAEDKYGCRIVQLAIESLSTCKKSANADALLSAVMNIICTSCERLASNEYANYIIQHIISAGRLSSYRDSIILDCILKNILSMSQEKYASHVVEKALEYAPPSLLKEMVEEIFDGYVPHPDTKKDALDIMLFHQYGNYVIQRMLNTCIEAARAKSAGIELTDMDLRLGWLRRLRDRVLQNEGKLSKYSSGKKILDMLQTCPPVLPASPLNNFAKDLSSAFPAHHSPVSRPYYA